MSFTRLGWKFTQQSWLGLLASDPIDPKDGEMWYNSTDNKLRIATSAGVFETSAFTLMP